MGENHTLDPKKYFIVIPALFGNGQSTSPSNSNIKPFPRVTFFDNVRAQHTLVTEHLGITVCEKSRLNLQVAKLSVTLPQIARLSGHSSG